jgi:hypothetical protein
MLPHDISIKRPLISKLLCMARGAANGAFISIWAGLVVTLLIRAAGILLIYLISSNATLTNAIRPFIYLVDGNLPRDIILALMIPAVIIFGYRGYHSNPQQPPPAVQRD